MRKRPHEDTLTSETMVDKLLDLSSRILSVFKRPRTDAPESAHIHSPLSDEAVAEGFTLTDAGGRSEIAAVKSELDAAKVELAAAEAKLSAAEAKLAAAEAKLAAAKNELTTGLGRGDQNIIKRADDYVSVVQEEVAVLSKSRNTAQARVDRLTESLSLAEVAARPAGAGAS